MRRWPMLKYARGGTKFRFEIAQTRTRHADPKGDEMALLAPGSLH